MHRIVLYSLLLLSAPLLAGCPGAKKPADLPELYPVKITVIQDGKPLADASVTLNAPTNASRFVVGYKTDANGVAVLHTDGKFKGAPAGKYKVLISKVYAPEIDPNEVPPEDPEARKEYDARMSDLTAQQAETVAVEYKRPTTTPAEIEVTSAGLETTIDVGEKVNVPLSELFKSSH